MQYRVKLLARGAHQPAELNELLDLGRDPLKAGQRLSFQHKGRVYHVVVKAVTPQERSRVPIAVLAEV